MTVFLSLYSGKLSILNEKSFNNYLFIILEYSATIPITLELLQDSFICQK